MKTMTPETYATFLFEFYQYIDLKKGSSFSNHELEDWYVNQHLPDVNYSIHIMLGIEPVNSPEAHMGLPPLHNTEFIKDSYKPDDLIEHSDAESFLEIFNVKKNDKREVDRVMKNAHWFVQAARIHADFSSVDFLSSVIGHHKALNQIRSKYDTLKKLTKSNVEVLIDLSSSLSNYLESKVTEYTQLMEDGLRSNVVLIEESQLEGNCHDTYTSFLTFLQNNSLNNPTNEDLKIYVSYQIAFLMFNHLQTEYEDLVKGDKNEEISTKTESLTLGTIYAILEQLEITDLLLKKIPVKKKIYKLLSNLIGHHEDNWKKAFNDSNGKSKARAEDKTKAKAYLSKILSIKG